MLANGQAMGVRVDEPTLGTQLARLLIWRWNLPPSTDHEPSGQGLETDEPPRNRG